MRLRGGKLLARVLTVTRRGTFAEYAHGDELRIQRLARANASIEAAYIYILLLKLAILVRGVTLLFLLRKYAINQAA